VEDLEGWVRVRLVINLTQSSQCSVTSATMARETTFDFLIVGGGTAGCVLASRLSQASFSVAIFEAGPEDYSDQIMSPLAAPTLLGSSLEYNYTSTEQPQ